MMEKIILASGSKVRADLMKGAGLSFDIKPADIDERAVEAALTVDEMVPEDIASILAQSKAEQISDIFPEATIVGADQVLALGDERFNKPADMEAARRQLLALSGKTHTLHSAVVCVKNGKTVWRHVSSAHLTMRAFDGVFVGRYLAKAGKTALQSVGCYQLEGLGIQLFERLEGDYFTILGMPMLPLLAFLRNQKLLEA
ncbi:MAG: Maf-like protein [Stappiaceae bacterium]